MPVLYLADCFSLSLSPHTHPFFFFFFFLDDLLKYTELICRSSLTPLFSELQNQTIHSKAFELNTAIFRELDVLSGFSTETVVLPPLPPPLVHKKSTNTSSSHHHNNASGLSSNDSSMTTTAAAAGCPFASLMKPGSINPHSVVSPRSPPVDHSDVAKLPSSCPFAGLMTPGSNNTMNPHMFQQQQQQQQQHHPQLQKKQQQLNMVKLESKCPFHKFSLVDVAIVLILTAVMLLMIPNKDSIPRS
jgi:hypothetical protein